jgi:MoaA/NifB/PqqE/SkfB family radical SAM enzyme
MTTDKFIIKDMPKTIYFYATSFCNSDCPFCAFRKSNANMARAYMPYDDVVKFWEESPHVLNDRSDEIGVVLQGGEYTLHPDAAKIAKFFESKCRKVTLLTNAIDPDKITPIVRYVNQITISLDGPNHDKVRLAPGNLQNIIKVLEYGYKVPINLQMTLGPWNMKAEDVEFVINMSDKYNAGLRFNVAFDGGILGMGKYKPDITNLKNIRNLIASNADDQDMNLVYLDNVIHAVEVERLPCMSTSIYSTILQNGDVLLCQGLPHENAFIGNVYHTYFDAIWEIAAKKRLKYRLCKECVLSCQLIGDIKFFYER